MPVNMYELKRGSATMEVVPKNAFHAVSAFSKRPPPSPVAKLISEKHVGSDGNFTLHMGFVIVGVLEDGCVYVSLDDFQKGHIPLASATVGDESFFIVQPSSSECVRQTQTQLPTHPTIYEQIMSVVEESE